MSLKFSLVILFLSLLFGCGSEQVNEEVNLLPTGSVLAENNPGNISSVCGVIFQVDDFDIWVSEYKKRAKGTIILLRNVIDPSLVVVFEGGESIDMVEERTSILTDTEFLTVATVMGTPLVSYYDVHYMAAPEGNYKHYVALIFETKDIKKILESLKENISLYIGYGLTPMGIGTNPHNSEQVYMLLTLEDYVSFRKGTNSPREIKRFVKNLKLPDETLILNLSKIDF